MSNAEVRRLAAELEGLRRQVRALSSAPRLARSSIEDGAVEEYDADGTLVSRIGRQPDSSHGVYVLDGPIPAVPSTPTGDGAPVSVTVVWGGTFADSAPTPMDLAAVEVYAAQAAFTYIEEAALVGVIVGEDGGRVTVSRPPGDWHVGLVAVTTAGKRSAVSPTIVLTARQVDAQDIAAGAITAEKIAVNAVTAEKITATALDGKVITGSTLQTAATGRRIVLEPTVDLGMIRMHTGHAAEVEAGRVRSGTAGSGGSTAGLLALHAPAFNVADATNLELRSRSADGSQLGAATLRATGSVSIQADTQVYLVSQNGVGQVTLDGKRFTLLDQTAGAGPELALAKGSTTRVLRLNGTTVELLNAAGSATAQFLDSGEARITGMLRMGSSTFRYVRLSGGDIEFVSSDFSTVTHRFINNGDAVVGRNLQVVGSSVRITSGDNYLWADGTNMGVGSAPAVFDRDFYVGRAIAANGSVLGSDARLKSDIEPYDGDALSVVKAVGAKWFRYLSRPDEDRLGFVAQDLVDTGVVSTVTAPGPDGQPMQMQVVDPTALLAVLWQAVQQVTARVETVTAQRKGT